MAEQALWTIDELVAATGGALRGHVAAPLTGVSIDSRSVTKGDIFAAIKGDRVDGHDYAHVALAGGAGLAIVSRPTEAMQAAGPLLIVDDVLKALEKMGLWARARSKARIIAVTGSVGKTSTKEMLRLALSASGYTHASVASFNNHWGVPLTLARMPADTAYGVFEIGMNHAGEITPLVKMVRPHIAVITTVVASHLGHFGSVAEIADAKAEIFLGVEPDGRAVLNRDNEYFERLSAAAVAAGIETVVGFGRAAAAEARLEKSALHADCSCITATILGEPVIYKLGMPGEHMVLNSLAALTAVKLAGADLARAGLALAGALPAKGRGVQSLLRAPGGRILLIDESYNANPVSVRAALALLKRAEPGKSGRRIAVLGDMLELGDQAATLHAELAGAVDEAKVDVLYASGPLMAHLWDKTPPYRRGAYADKSDGLAPALLGGLKAGDVVMVKGSLGSRMGPLVDAIKGQFSPAEKDGR
ncbi:UDP-N-acetylmuramoylalanyl-D-glutamyl-2,6-diaminopimelate--D-alanyl-D-alanine ligase [Taklimakanibacter lacteus]|uniref:UDP-N-acetylmuramoylalanyl-D-glutamyl-2, 6-diaminopimelate--D-alanyl-D-alanine ligase n=1 Tax=Taklimakanibacter lacteus TaxID=2268456 RepID=UPI000E66374A